MSKAFMRKLKEVAEAKKWPRHKLKSIRGQLLKMDEQQAWRELERLAVK